MSNNRRSRSLEQGEACTPVPPPIRVQGPHESGCFSADAWGYLMTLRRSGAVTLFNFEQIVERAIGHAEGRISLAEIRAFTEDQVAGEGANARKQGIFSRVH